MMKTLRAFLEFCYIARRDVIDTQSLTELEQALDRFHQYRTIFLETGVRVGFNLPRQHFLSHYPALIRSFGAPNGLCSSITESKHIKAVKKPWRRSSCYKALGQMLLTNQRLDKLAASRVDFARRGMLVGTCLSYALYVFAGQFQFSFLFLIIDNSAPPEINEVASNNPVDHIGNDVERNIDDDDDDGGDAPGPTVLATVELAKTLSKSLFHYVNTNHNNNILIVRRDTVENLAASLDEPDLMRLIQSFLQDQLRDTSSLSNIDSSDDEDDLPAFNEVISVYNSAVATFYAPSDLSGIGGMHRERIRALSSWRKEGPRYDCIFVNTDPTQNGMRGLEVARVRAFFSFKFRNISYPCALVRWYSCNGDEPDEDTGMWVVEPDSHADGSPFTAIIHLESILRAAHLIGVFGQDPIPKDIPLAYSLDVFRAYYVNKYIDHHSFEIAF
jgi:hypothetical protein